MNTTKKVGYDNQTYVEEHEPDLCDIHRGLHQTDITAILTPEQ